MDQNKNSSVADEGINTWTSKWIPKGSKNHAKAQKIINSVNFDEIITNCTKERMMGLDSNTDEPINCTILDLWSMGSRAIVFDARFADGVRWAIKVSMACLEGIGEPSDFRSSYAIMSGTFHNEYMSMRFIKYMPFSPCINDTNLCNREHTAVPVATAYSTGTIQTSLGPTVYLAMDLIPGASGSHWFSPQLSKETPENQKLAMERQNSVLRSLAEVQIMLASYSSPWWSFLGKQGEAEKMEEENPLVGDFVARAMVDDGEDGSNPMTYYDDLLKPRGDSESSEANPTKNANSVSAI